MQLSGDLDRLLNARLGAAVKGSGLSPLQEAERIYRFRRMRDRRLEEAGASELFREPAWDMLLDLYIAQAKGRAISVSSLCIAACVPGATGLRWIALLVERGLVERRADPKDRRRTFIGLTASAVQILTGLLLERGAR